MIHIYHPSLPHKSDGTQESRIVKDEEEFLYLIEEDDMWRDTPYAVGEIVKQAEEGGEDTPKRRKR